MEPLKEGPQPGHNTELAPVPESTATETVQESIKPEGPDEIPGVRNYTRVKFQTRQYYIPIMKGSKYAMYVNQLEYYGALHLDAHILFMQNMQK